MEKPKVITLCGSVRFQDKHMEVAHDLEIAGNAVISIVYPVPNTDNKLTTEELDMLAKMHRAKIDISDAVYVVNVDGYVGESTKSEIKYAKSKGKEIIWMETPKQ